MGFGLLLTGYLMTYLLSLSSYGAFPAIIGCVIMLYALTKLIEYEPGFRYAFYAAAVKPKRPVKPAAPKPQSSEPKPAAVKEGN